MLDRGISMKETRIFITRFNPFDGPSLLPAANLSHKSSFKFHSITERSLHSSSSSRKESGNLTLEIKAFKLESCFCQDLSTPLILLNLAVRSIAWSWCQLERTNTALPEARTLHGASNHFQTWKWFLYSAYYLCHYVVCDDLALWVHKIVKKNDEDAIHC